MSSYVRLLAVPAAALAAAASLWVFVGLPSWKDLPEIRHELAQRRGQLEAVTSPTRGGSSAEDGRELDAALATVRGAGAPLGGELDVIVTLERRAEARRLTQRLQLGDPTPLGRSSWQQSDVNLEVIGSFGAIVGYLDDLRGLPWMLNVTSLSIQREGTDQVRAAIAGTMLWRPS